MAESKLGEFLGKHTKEVPARTVDVFRTFASLSSQAKPSGFHGEVEILSNSYTSTARGGFSYPEVLFYSRGLGRRTTALGWIWFAGTPAIGGQRRRLLLPAVSIPVHGASEYGIVNRLIVSEAPELFGLVDNPEVRDALLTRLVDELGWSKKRTARLGRLRSPSKWVDVEALRPWIDEVARASGFEVAEVRFDDPAGHADKDTVTAHIGCALVDRGIRYGGARGFDLNELHRLMDVRGTAFNALYGAKVDLDKAPEQTESRPLLSFRPLSHRQRTVAERLAGSRLAALSGAPGTGKTHIISVVAADAIARGESVLVVAGSPHAVDALVEHFVQTPGPPPVTFGGTQGDTQLRDELAWVSERIDAGESISAEQKELAAAHDERAKTVRDTLASLGAAASDPTASHVGLDTVLAALVAGEGEAARVAGEMLTSHWIGRLNRQTKGTLRKVGELSQMSNADRRKELAGLNPEYLTKVLPLWVGSVDDADDVLPTYLQMFDLVIFDEASQIDQVRAANTLVRAQRALVCGDPAQIGIDKAPSDEALRRAKVLHGTTDVDFDVQNRSLFDVAAAQVPVEVLDEHFRSAPHLIEFSSRRFYDGGLHTSTRKPANEASDLIDLVVVDGERGEDGTNNAEVEACLEVLDRYLESDLESLGVVTPSEAQAEALRSAVDSRFSVEERGDHGILVGTVDQLQGHERDGMVLSFGVGGNEEESAWRHVNDPRFFNVMVTRARRHATVITSNPSPPGLAGEYVLWEQPLVDLVRDVAITDPWTLQVAEVLAEAGIAVRAGYRTGRYVIDLVAGVGASAVAIDCTLHSDGIDPHIDRALLVRRTGWRTASAFEEIWKFRLDQYPDFLRERFPDL